MSLVNNTQVAKGILMSLINNVLGTLHAILHSGCTNHVPANSVERLRFLHVLSSTCY